MKWTKTNKTNKTIKFLIKWSEYDVVTIVVYSGVVTVQFTSDQSVTGNGFLVNVSPITNVTFLNSSQAVGKKSFYFHFILLFFILYFIIFSFFNF